MLLECPFLGRRKLTPYRHLLSLAEQLLYFNTRIIPCQYLNYSAVATVPTLLGLIFTPGPIVEATATDLMYCPFVEAGLALMIASRRALKFSRSLSEPNEALPIGQ